MAKWRCVHADISLSDGLRGLRDHDALLYTWLIPHADSWGLIERCEVKGRVFPYRSTERRVAEGIDRLLAAGKVCQQENGRKTWLHLCWWEDFQGEIVRKGRGQPALGFTCPNDTRTRPDTDSTVADASESRAVKRGKAPRSAAQRPTVTSTVTVTRQDKGNSQESDVPVNGDLNSQRYTPRIAPKLVSARP